MNDVAAGLMSVPDSYGHISLTPSSSIDSLTPAGRLGNIRSLADQNWNTYMCFTLRTRILRHLLDSAVSK